MTRQIRLTGFIAFSPVHLSPGLWAHPRSRDLDYKDLDHWVDLARLLERGRFDALIIADGIGIHDVYGGTADAAIRSGAQVPKHDPLMLVSALAHATTHLGFGVTASTSHELPAVLARRFSTLDHFTDGRIGWNIATGVSDSGARAFGREAVIGHDARYERADEFLDVTYKLWEGSWQDGAVLRDRASGLFADPGKVHRIRHRGAHFDLDTIHLAEPSPQRTPFLFQAGASPRGRAFAARHAEAVLVGGPTRASVASSVRDIRARRAALGRDPRDIAVFTLATLIVAPTREEARAKHDEYRRYSDPDGVLALLSGWTGIDLSRFDLDAPLRPGGQRDDAVLSVIDGFTRADPDRVWTLREVITHTGIGGRGPLLVGSPADVADEMEAWVAEADVDGFNLSYAFLPETFADVVDHLVPGLQRRGLYKRDYAPGSLRAKLTGSDRLKPSHPGAAFRDRARIAPAA
ncbi:Dimethyl-sulfide monooxygenase [Methylobacterium crusticola]|uniref:Dimethyl-sulfide monooxygenase n=1 Tax=Methylobacterium crusticola TaxID=1697972 RepID=A0ABQ4R8I4_9HYPH|nr:LLM class flavin-dependent oxidoreductase [Methylobacterium crusticola]GJD53702.1 Dimethyl-sulfide monooxygenase [Methylobacterium crusticola]